MPGEWCLLLDFACIGLASDEILTTRLPTPRNRHRLFGALALRDESRRNH
jgi:hypothetical protein